MVNTHYVDPGKHRMAAPDEDQGLFGPGLPVYDIPNTISCPVPGCQFKCEGEKAESKLTQMSAYREHWQLKHARLVTLYYCPRCIKMNCSSVYTTQVISSLTQHMEEIHKELAHKNISSILKYRRDTVKSLGFIKPGSFQLFWHGVMPVQNPAEEIPIDLPVSTPQKRKSGDTSSGQSKIAKLDKDLDDGDSESSKQGERHLSGGQKRKSTDSTSEKEASEDSGEPKRAKFSLGMGLFAALPSVNELLGASSSQEKEPETKTE